MTSHVGSLHEEAEQCGRRGWAALGREGRRGVTGRTSDILGKDNGSGQSGEAIDFVVLGIRSSKPMQACQHL